MDLKIAVQKIAEKHSLPTEKVWQILQEDDENAKDAKN